MSVEVRAIELEHGTTVEVTMDPPATVKTWNAIGDVLYLGRQCLRAELEESGLRGDELLNALGFFYYENPCGAFGARVPTRLAGYVERAVHTIASAPGALHENPPPESEERGWWVKESFQPFVLVKVS